MADCGCDKAKAELEEFLRGEMCHTERADIAEHVDKCPPCSEEKTTRELLTKKVRDACCETAPEELTVRILSGIRGDSGT
jgi:anti-sigma factor (TIGR02949 family)